MEKETENLKSVDLMLGDYVICHHPSRPQEIVNVTSGLLSIIEKQENGIIDSNSPLYRIVKPIPITKEILENNRFIRLGRQYDVWLLKSFSLRRRNGIFGYYEQGNPCTPTFICNYVHELQHALRLCKIEKEIIL